MMNWLRRNLNFLILSVFAAVSLFFLLEPKLPGKNISKPLPVKYWDGDGNSPMIFYLSGDAGFNSFSTYFSENLARRGYDVYMLNTKKYFWLPRTPLSASLDISGFIEGLFRHRKNQKLVLVGYSFGADALPFILEKFPQKTRQRLLKTVLIDPSVKGGLEISLQDYLREESGSWSTIPAVNRLQGASLAVILSAFAAKHYPFQKITLKDKKLYRLPGNHRFNNDYNLLSETVLKSFKSH